MNLYVESSNSNTDLYYLLNLYQASMVGFNM